MMQGSGEIFDFFTDNTISGRENPTRDNPVPGNLFRTVKRKWI